MSAADVASWVSAFAAAGGFLAAAGQIYGFRRDALSVRAAEIASVALETDVVQRPESPNAGNGRGRWIYNFTVRNPGRLPISRVEVLINFPIDVTRQRAESGPDVPSSTLDMNVPVIAARGQKTWRRIVLVDHTHHEQLRNTISTVTFTSPDAGRIRTQWPPTPDQDQINADLRKRLRNYRA
jgi:hypothetical protein